MTPLKRTVLALVVAALVLGGTVYAIDTTDPDDESFASSAFIANIIEEFPELALTPDAIQALRDAGYGWGEIVIACSIAVNSGQTLDGVMALASEGAGWGEIAKQLGVSGRAFGQYVREIVGKGGAKVRERHESEQLDDAAAMDVVRDRFGLEEDDVQALIAMGLDAQDILCAVSIAAVTGDASRVSVVLELRARQQSWLSIAEAVGVGKDAVVKKGVATRNRVEFRNALREQIREQVRSGDEARREKGKPEDPGKGKDPGGSGGGSGNPGGPGKGGS
ncbi:MAG: hypothetical protein ACM3ZO_08810 [Clostridia bacterium]